MTKPVINAFSKDYVSKVQIDHRDRKYKRPVLNQPPANARASLLNTQEQATQTEKYRRLSRSEI